MTPKTPTTVDSSHWVIRLVVVTDWHDGPREGVCALSEPELEFWFELQAERSQSDDLDDRLFRVFDLPLGTVDQLTVSLQVLGSPSGTVWSPIWSCGDTTTLERLEREVSEVRARARESDLIIRSGDMKSFGGVWKVPPGADVDDWFGLLSI